MDFLHVSKSKKAVVINIEAGSITTATLSLGISFRVHIRKVTLLCGWLAEFKVKPQQANHQS